jgi:CBS-domain-containing membrane protein
MASENHAPEGEPETTKRTLVREAMEKVGSKGCVVSPEDDLVVVSERLADSPGVHIVAVVDDQSLLLGVIPLRLLVDELFLDVAPEEFLVSLREVEDVEEFGRIIRARTAGELMEEPAYVTMDDTVREAYTRMHERKLEGLPIVDDQLRVVGYLDRLQLVRLWLKRHRRSGS